MNVVRCLQISLVSAIALTTLAMGSFASADEPSNPPAGESPLPGTEPLTWSGDIASRLVDGADRFLLGELEKSVAGRAKYWTRDVSSAEKYNASIEPNRRRLARILGVRDPRIAFDAPELVGTTAESALIARGANYEVFAVRWPAFGDVHGEGLLLTPGGKHLADVVAIPDADQTPEMLAGLAPGVPRDSQFARRLCESGCRVLVPMLIHRAATRGKISDREILYRSAFEMGRHIIGYEVQKVLAGVDWFRKEGGEERTKIGVIGWGEGGLLALDAGALDPRIGTVSVSGYFDSRQNVWQEPIYRNVFGLLEQFGDAELAAMIAPRKLVIEAAKGPELVVPPGTGAAPGRLTTPRLDVVRKEVERARRLTKVSIRQRGWIWLRTEMGAGHSVQREHCRRFWKDFRPAQSWRKPRVRRRSWQSCRTRKHASDGNGTKSTCTIKRCCSTAPTGGSSSLSSSTRAPRRLTARPSSRTENTLQTK